jgi:hypothetical protein
MTFFPFHLIWLKCHCAKTGAWRTVKPE